MATVKFDYHAKEGSAQSAFLSVVSLEKKSTVAQFPQNAAHPSATIPLDSGSYMLAWTFVGKKDSTFQMTVTGGSPSPLDYPNVADKASQNLGGGVFAGHGHGLLIVG